MWNHYWELLHTVPYDDDYYEFIRLIGIFSSKKKAMEAIKILKTKPWFLKYPDHFYIRDARIDEDGWIEGFIDE